MNSVKHRDWRKRIVRYDGGRTEYIYIERVICTDDNCGKLHNKLPDMLIKYKHYVEDLITGVIDGDIVQYDEMNEAYPCDETMKRWHHWFMANYLRIEGYISNDKSDNILEIPEIRISNLETERKKNNRWLSSILQTIYNSGGYLEPL